VALRQQAARRAHEKRNSHTLQKFHEQIVPHTRIRRRAGENPKKQGKFRAKTRKDRPATGRPFLLGRIVPTEAKPSELSGEILCLGKTSVKAKYPRLQISYLSAAYKTDPSPCLKDYILLLFAI
jgi:hypothetical protein